jgi:acetyl esterase/lipase
VTRIQPHRYGPHHAQVADLHLPAGAPAGVVILLHGGYWRAIYDRHQLDPVIADLVARGWAAWNLDYRAVGAGPCSGGGWPATFADVAAGLDALAEPVARLRIPARRIGVFGHSAGGTLALWSAARHRLPAGEVGADPLLRPAAVVAASAICDLVDGAHQHLGAGAVADLMGGMPAEVPAYRTASPTALLPLGVPILAITGEDDEDVPVAQSRAFAERARAAGDDVRLAVHPGQDHFAPLDAASAVWHQARDWLLGTLHS